MQHKEKLLHTTRRAGLRLICLLAALLALSPLAAAYNAASIKGYFPNIGLGESMGQWEWKSMTRESDTQYSLDLTPTNAGDAYIQFKLNEDQFEPQSGGNTEMPSSSPSANNAKSGTTGQFILKVTSATVNKKHTIHITCTDNSKNTGAKIWYTVEGSGSGSTGGSFKICGLTDSDIQMSGGTNPANDATYTYSPSANATKYFNISDGKAGKNVGPNTDNAAVTFTNDNCTFNDCQENTNKWKIVLEARYVYTFHYYNEYNGKHRLEITRADKVKMPVVPARVTNRNDMTQWESVTSSNPAVYLLGNVINGERVTPEWEMISTDGGNTYVLDFTARETRMTVWADNNNWKNYPYKAAVYTGMDADAKYSSEISFGNDNSSVLFEWKKQTYDGQQQGDLYPGRRCRATYTRSSDSLSITTLDEETNYPPYMSIIGYHFKQNKEYTTPLNNQNSSGWQEAWLQFDSKGNVMTDMKGKVMYNTMWPPKNPVYFYVQPKAGGDYVELTSERLQMVPETLEDGSKKVLTGAQWKEQLKDDANYDNLFSVKFNNGVGNTQRMDDNRKYIRYVASNVWVLGTAKIWTGWTSTLTENNNKQANWSNHANWGIKDVYKNEEGTSISPGEPWNLKAQAGNFKFDNPTFFKTVEVFYCVDKNVDASPYYAMYDGCIFYTTQGYGDPAINARSVADFTKADYEISVSNVPDGATVKEYTVYRYNAITGKPCNETGEEVAKTASVVLTKSGLSLSDTQFNNEKKFNTASPAEQNLADGKYYYELEVTFVSGDNKTRKETVTSPIVTIFNPNVNTRLANSQLVEVMDKEDENVGNFDYITFAAEDGAVYGVNVTGDHIELTTILGDVKYVYDNNDKGRFTDMVLLVSPLSSKFSDSSANYPLSGVGSYTVYGKKNSEEYADAAGEKVHGGKQADNSYREIRKLTDLADNSFNVVLDYTYNVEENNVVSKMDGKSTPHESVAHLTVPEPKLKEATIEFFYGKDNTAGTDDERLDFSFRGHNLTNARYQNLREHVEVEMPNATDNLGKLFSSWKVKLADEVLTLTDGVYNGVAKAPADVYAPAYTDKNVTLADFSYTNVYKRWTNGVVKPVDISDDAPNKFDHSITDSRLGYDEKGNLHATFTLNVKLDNDIENVITRYNKDGNVIDRDGNVITNNSNKPRLLHKDNDDYFYVTVVDKTLEDTPIVKDAEGNPVKFVAKVSELKEGKAIKFDYNWGHWWNGLDKHAIENPYYKNLQVRVSFLYPFYVHSREEKPGLSRQAADHTGNVIKSKAAPWSPGDGVATSVDGIDAESGATVKAGTGYIEVVADGEVEIYSADGLKVATGAGRHDLSAGVYMVRVDSSVQKVVVR